MLDVPPPVASPNGLPKLSSESIYQLPDLEKKPSFRRRVMVGGFLVAIGLGVLGIGAASIFYRLTHLTVSNGLLNGRQVRVQAPSNGEIKDFFARPGVAVRKGQVLARLAPGQQQEQALLQAQGEVATRATQLAAARSMLSLLERQLQSLTGQDNILNTMNTQIAGDDVTKNEAGVNAAIAVETAARLKYERYRKLQADGAVSRQVVDQFKAEWLAAQAAVTQARAALGSTQTTLMAAAGGIPLGKGLSLQEQRLSLTRSVATQRNQVKTLETQLATSQKRLAQVQSALSDRRDVEVSAPLNGVIYTTAYDAGEQVNRPAVLLTLLDCNDLWLETLVNAEQANRIDAQQPVRVQLVGEPETLVGRVDLVEAISRAELAKEQARSLIPTVPSELLGQPIARVVVRIPPTTQQDEGQKLCGVGQSARLTFGMKLFAAN